MHLLMLTEQSRCRVLYCGSTNDHRDSLTFVQEVARLVTKLLFWKKKVNREIWKVAKSSHKVAKLAILQYIGLDHDMGLMYVCCWTTGRLSESQRLFLFSNGWSHHWEIRSHVRSNSSHSRALMCSQIFQVNILYSADNMFGNPCSRITLPNTLLNKLKSAFINIRKKFNIFNGLPATRSKQHH